MQNKIEKEKKKQKYTGGLFVECAMLNKVLCVKREKTIDRCKG